MCFKLDTGAKVSAISDLPYKTLENSTLQKPAKVLIEPTRNALKVLGQFDGTFWIGAVRICIDIKPLKLMPVYPHPIPKVDETLAQLSGATVFSKVDANSGFWQIPLAEESQPYTIFIFRSYHLVYLVHLSCFRDALVKY